MSAGLPTTAALGIRYALQPAPGRQRGGVRANLVGSIVAVTAVITAGFSAPASTAWSPTRPATAGTGTCSSSPRAGTGTGTATTWTSSWRPNRASGGWSTFAFTQLAIDGQSIPVLGIATHGDAVEPPTVSGRRLDGPDEIELGDTSLRQLGKQVGDTVTVGTGATARRLKIVGAVTLPSIGVSLADHVSLGRGAMLPEHTLLSIENFSVGHVSQAAFTALPSTLAIDLRPGAAAPLGAADPGRRTGRDPGRHVPDPIRSWPPRWPTTPRWGINR